MLMASSGKITAHNLHLLQDDQDNNLGDGGGISPIMPEDDMNLRTATADSRSSADSRKLDESPVDDELGAPPANLSEEAKYQEELKERVKKSFADLGMEAEGVLLKDSLDDTPRDSIEITDNLIYEEPPQGEYDARRKKESNIENDVDDDSEMTPEEGLDGEGDNHEDGQEHPFNDRTLENDDDNGDDNFLADSLEADTADNQQQPNNNTGIENVTLHPSDDNLQENGRFSPEHGDRDEPNGQDEEGDDFVRDSLETDRAESELHDLNDSNPISLGVTEEKAFDGDASDSFPTPVNQVHPEEQFPRLSEPLDLEDRDEEVHPTQEEEDAENNHDEDENYSGIGKENAPSEHEHGDVNERTLSGNGDTEFDDGYDNSGIQNKTRADVGKQDSISLGNGYDERQSPSLAAANELSDGDQLRDSLDDDISENEKPISKELRQSESRVESALTQNGLPSNINNNAKGPHDRPPSGGSAHSIRSNLNSRQGDLAGVSSPANRTPVRSRDNSRERGMSSRSRQASTERVSPATSRPQTSTERVSSGTLRPQSGTRNGSSRSRNREHSSRNSGSRERQDSRRGSNDINIPRYSRKGLTNSDVENGSSQENLRNNESRDRTVRSGSSKSERTLTESGNSRKVEQVIEPNHASSASKPPPGPARASPNDPRSGGRPGSKGKRPSPRDFMTPGQKIEVEENKQFWSDMHQAGVFNQPINPSAKARAEQVEKLKSGEKVRVEYISDDSGDEDLHFVDEKGSPIDQLGRPLFPAKTPETPDMKIMYRIKPSPPQQKIKKSSGGRQRTRDVSAAESSRYGSGYSSRNGSGNRSGRQASRIPRKQLVDRQVSPIEDEISPADTQQEGVLDSALPPAPQQQEPLRERPVKSACLQTGLDDTPSSEDVQDSHFKSPIQEASIQTEEREIAIQPSEDYATGNNDNSLPYQSPVQSPRNSRGEGPFGQVRVAPYQQQSSGYQQPSPGYNQQGQVHFPAGAYAQQVPTNYPGNPHAHWQPVIGPPGYPNQSQQFAAPLQPQFANPMMQNYPGPQYHPQMQDPMQQVPYQQHLQQPPHQHPHPGMNNQYHPEFNGPMASPGRPYPGQEMEQPYSNDTRYDPDQPERKQSHEPRKQQPKPRHNFIDLNKTSAKLRRDPPNKKYTEALNQKKGFKSPMNPRKPLPQISRESSLDDGQTSSTGWTPHGSATSRSNDQWAHAVAREQQMIMLARGMSDPNIYPQAQVPPPAQMRNGSLPGNYAGGNPYQGGYSTTVTNPNQVNGQPYSWSADRANTYARMNAMQNGNQPPMGGPHNMDPRASFEMNQTSPRQRMAYTHPMPSRTSPFQVLPDIHGSGRRSGEDGELRTSDPDGYLVKLQKQKQGPQYKPYTLKDFQNLKKDFKLGGLGPDKETMGVRNDKVARQREYARQVMEQNKKTIRQSPKTGTPQGKDSPQTEASKRELALEYAKQIPKPRIPTPPEVLHDRLYGSGANSRQSGAGSRGSSVKEDPAGSHEQNTALEMARLQELTQRHNQEKDELDRLRKGSGVLT